MKMFSDFIAIVLFFATYLVTKDIVLATAVAVIIGIAQSIYLYIKYKKLTPMQWVSLLIIIIFGGATIILRDPVFIQWKPSIFFWVSAIALLVSLLLKKNPLKASMGKEIELPENIWRQLTYAWIFFLIFMGIVNVIVFKNFSEEQWVKYKTLIAIPIMLLFTIIQGIYISKYIKDEKA